MALQLFKIADVTVATPQANVEFTSIPQGYTDLIIHVSARTNRAGVVVDTISVRFNGSTSGYSNRGLGYQSDASPFSFTNAGSSSVEDTGATTGEGALANTFGSAFYYIPNYTTSNNKSFSTDGVQENNGRTYGFLTASLWSNSAAITSINLYPFVGTAFLTNSTFTLYGIL